MSVLNKRTVCLLLTSTWIEVGTGFTLLNSPFLSTEISTRSGLPRLSLSSEPPPDRESSPLDFVLNPYDSKIPKELEQEIYAAEANTQAAQDRNSRVALYAIIAFTGILGAFFNVFLSELRAPQEGVTEMVISLDEAGFGWVEQSNFLVRFLFLNKIGGGLLLLSGAAAGLLAEAEYDTRRLNAEKIFEEMKRRRADKEQGGKNKRTKGRKKKRRSGKESKRLGALAEIVEEESPEPEPLAAVEVSKEEESPKVEGKEKDEGIFGKIKGFYDRADSMAASQALLLNKKLEDEGLIDKITDESGLKVIGKEEAAKLKSEGESLKDPKKE